jgi:hypothetical protein
MFLLTNLTDISDKSTFFSSSSGPKMPLLFVSKLPDVMEIPI